MEFGDWLELSFKVFGGLGLFLLGMKNMSEGMQAVAGDRLRKIIAAVTSNRIMACGIGTLITAIIQSSSVTTVMVVGMVNASVMTLKQAVGVILGANIGTTFTAFILQLKIGKFGLPIIGVMAFFYLFSKRERFRYVAMTILGLGLVFYGLELMKEGFSPLSALPEFKEWFSRFSPDTYFGVIRTCLVGALLTALVQSSSATVGITMALAFEGLIDFDTAAALVLGENIGTTITALLASIGSSTTARRAAYAHTLINILGVMWITSIFAFYVDGIREVMGHFDLNPDILKEYNDDGEIVMRYVDTGTGIWLTHFGFNFVNMLVFLPLMGLMVKLLERIAPERGIKEKPHLSFLDVRMLDTPALGIEQSRNEMLRMADIVKQMSGHLRGAIETLKPDEERDKEIFHLEEVTDIQQKEIVEFLSHLLSGNVPHHVMDTGRGQIRVADELETIADYMTSELKLILRMNRNNIEMSDDGRRQVLDLHDHVAEYLDKISEALRKDNVEILEPASVDGRMINRLAKDYRNQHLARVESGEVSPLSSLVYMDMLRVYRRMKDHAFNIAEVIAGDK